MKGQKQLLSMKLNWIILFWLIGFVNSELTSIMGEISSLQ